MFDATPRPRRAALAAALLWPGLAAAQEPAPVRLGAGLQLAQAGDGAVLLDPVTATGTRVPATAIIGPPPEPFAGGQVARGARLGLLGNRSLQDTPFSVLPLTERVIVDQQARTIRDVLKNDAAVTHGATQFFGEAFRIRGFPIGNFNLLFNGLALDNNSQASIPLEGIERIEIIRGPTTSLTGLSANGAGVGGAINLIPKRAPDGGIAVLTGRYGTRATYGTEVDVGQRFGPGGEWGVRFNGAFREGATPFDRVDERYRSAQAAFDYRGERVRASLDLGYFRRSVADYFDILAVAPGLAVPPAHRATINRGQPGAWIDRENLRAVARAEVDLVPGWTAGVALGGAQWDGGYITGGLNTVFNAAGDTRFSANYAPEQYQRDLAAEVSLRGELRTGPVRHDLAFLYGLSEAQFKGSFNAAGTAPILVANSNIYRPIEVQLPRIPALPPRLRSLDSQARAFAAADTLSILEGRVALTVGLRWTALDYQTRDVATRRVTGDFDDEAVTPFVAALVKPLPWLSLYGNYVEALERGGIAPATAVNAGQALAPLRSEQIEGGVKLDLGDIGASAAIFRIEKGLEFTDPASRRFLADGRQVHRGFETTVFGEPTPGVRVLAGLQLLDPELARTAGGQFDGRRPLGVPRLQTVLTGEVDVPFAPGLTLTGGLFHTSKQFIEASNARSIPSWTRLDVGARYVLDLPRQRVIVRFNVENAGGGNYWASVSDGGFLTVGAPTTYLVSTSLVF